MEENTEIKRKYKFAIDTIMFPVRYEYNTQQIYDKEGNLVCDIRGWGRIQYLSEAEKRQDQIGEMIAELINSTHQ
jgi:Cu2+-containing amine oxidase